MWTVPAGYRAVPPEFNIAQEALDDPIERDGVGDAPALRFDGGELTFLELRRQVDGLARGLAELPIGRGDHVLIRSPNTPDYCALFLALAKLGAIPVLTHSLLSGGELEGILEHVEPPWLIADEDVAEPLRAAARARGLHDSLIVIGRPGRSDRSLGTLIVADQSPLPAARTRRDDPAFMVFTSGTTGRPKGIVHAQRWLGAVGDLARLRGETFVPGEVSLCAGEMTTISALGHGLLFPLRGGGCCAMIKGRALPERVLRAIGEFRVTHLFGTPSLYRSLLSLPAADTQAFDLRTLRFAHSGGEAAGPMLKEQWETRFSSEFYEYLGISEFQIILANGPGLPVRPGSVGVAFPDTGVTVIDEHLRPCPSDEPGMLAVPADDPGLFLSYFRQPELWRLAHRGRWFLSGDVLRRDEDGYFWFTGRSDDIFKSRGYSISPVEIENALCTHPAVAEALVVPVPDKRWGNSIKALIVLADGWSAGEALQEEVSVHVRSLLAPYKMPRVIGFRTELPRSGPLHKIARRTLAEGS